MDEQKIRRTVERVIDRYLEINTFDIQAMAYDPDTRITGGTAIAATDRHARTWKGSVGAILRALPTEPLAWDSDKKRMVPAYRYALERGAVLRRNEYDLGRGCALLAKRLSDPRVSNHRGRRDDLRKWQDLELPKYGLIHDERCRIQKDTDLMGRSVPYRRAALLFWIEVGERDRQFPAENIWHLIFDEVEGRKRRVS